MSALVASVVAEAVLLLSFGGPEGPDDVMPFLRNVTRGRGIPDERLAEVAEHYLHFDGVSPINAQNRALLDALQAELSDTELRFYWGNRNWHPYVEDAVAQMRTDGVASALVFATSATASYSSCRQYREDIARARAAVGDGAPELIKLPHFYNMPGYIQAHADGVRAAIDELPEAVREGARLIFTAHSIPVSMNETSGPERDGLYARQQHETARLVVESVRAGSDFDLVWQSRSGPPQVPWLEPDINDHLRALAAAGTTAVVVCPTGFVSDHLEVLWDLDTEARATAAELGLAFARAATAGTHPAFVAGIAGMIRNLRGEATGSTWAADSGWDCPAACCPAPSRRSS